MFPLNVILVGCKAEMLAPLRRELATHVARIEAEFDDVGAAVARLSSSPKEIRLVIFCLRHAEDLPTLNQLTRAFVGWPVLTLVAPAADASLLIRAMRAGASQVVHLPLNSEDFREALNCVGVQHGQSPSDPTVVAVLGLTGGCGATSLAVNLAWEIATQLHTPCILAELSLKPGMLDSYLNVQPRCTTHDLFKHAQIDLSPVKEALTHVTDNLELLASPRRLAGPLDVSTELLRQVIQHLRRLARVVILDVPATYDDVYFETLAASDQIVLVGEQKVASARALKMVNDALDRDADLKTQHLVKHVVINRYDPNIEGFGLKELMHVLAIPDMRSVANDPNAMSAAVKCGKSLRQVAAHSRALTDIENLARKVIAVADGAVPPGDAEHGKAHGFSRLLKAFGL
jgi:pilus assembly protein CpaE